VISPTILERPGPWRGIISAGMLALVAGPGLVLLSTTAGSLAGLGEGFWVSTQRSLAVAAGSAGLALILGLPAGLAAGLYRFPAQRLLLGVLALPLLMPPFLWAIGLSMLRIELGLPRDTLLSGAAGVIGSFAALGTPLVTFAVLVTIRLQPASAIDAARLSGGESAVLREASRTALPTALAAALLAGLVSLADPGPGQILGFSGVATEILISFSALYDFELAARQGAVAGTIVLVAAAPLIWLAARRLAFALLPKDARLTRPHASATARWAGPAALSFAALIILIPPIAGLASPARNGFWLSSVLTAVTRTGGNTLYYGLIAGVVATLCAIPLALCAARVAALRAAVLATLMLVIVLPPAIPALGTVLVASDAPAWLDPILRSRFTVAAVLGLRLTAIATVVVLRVAAGAPRSWASAAAVHGVPLSAYVSRVLVPFLVRPMILSIGLVALVATADITTVLLLQPPGRDSLPTAIFTVMANAPESMVASLCLAYLLLAAAIISGALLIARVFAHGTPGAR
jgi:iron(III) transport system permease protein